MKNVSNEFKEIIKAGGPFYSYAKVVLANGEQLTVDSENDFAIDGNGYSESGGSGFPLGVAMSKQITILLDNSDDRYSGFDFYGAEITLYTEADIPGGTVERIPEGIFTVIDSVAPGDVLEITACDNMYKLDAEYTSKLTYPATLQQMWNELCSTYDLSSGSPAFENNDFQVQTKPEGLTGRQMAGYIAQLAMGNAIVDKNGRLTIKSYDFTGFDDVENIDQGEIETSAGYPVLSEFTQNPDIGTDDVTITGVTATVEVEGEEEEKTIIYGTSSYALAIDNPLIARREETAIALIGDRLIGLTIRPFSGEFFPNPTIEFADLAYLVDRKDKVYKTIITDHDFDYLGSSSLSNGLESPERNRSSYPNNTTEIYRKTQAAINKSRKEWEKAMEELKDRVDNSSGLYMTKEQQQDGSNIYYMHDKPTLEESVIVWKMTAEAFAVSSDGGKTYNAGLTVDGTLIAKIMNTIGINFDWGVGGTLVIQDQEGDQTAYINAETGEVRLSVQTLTIGGKTVQDIVSDEMGDYQPLNLSLSNQYQGIATDANGDCEIFPLVQTQAHVYYGQSDITDACVFSINTSQGITGTWELSNHTYTVTGLSTDDGWVDITATYLNALITTKRFTVSKIKGGENSRSYYIQSDAQIIKGVENNELSPNIINLSAYYREGLSSYEYAGRYKIEEQVDGVWSTVYESQTDESTIKRYLYGALSDGNGNIIVNSEGYGIGIIRDIDEVRVTFYAAGGFDTAISVISIPVIDTVASLSQKDAFNLLTNNGTAKGVYMVENELYINASYIVTGILTDLLGKNFWDFNTGEFSLSSSVKVGDKTVNQIAQDAVDAMSQDDVFNKLTNNGSISGVFMKDGQLYINASYILSGILTLGGANNTNGALRILNASGQQIGSWDCNGIQATQANISGTIDVQSGKIGNWEIKDGNITNGIPFTNEQNSNSTGMGTYGTDWAFWAGNGKFSVKQSGKLVSQDADISGNVNASSGSFNSVSIAGSRIDATNIHGGTHYDGYMSGGALQNGISNTATLSGGTYSGPYISGGSLASTGGSFGGGCYGSTLSGCTLGGTTLTTGNGEAYMKNNGYGSIFIYGTNGAYVSGANVNLNGAINLAGKTNINGGLSVTGTKNRLMQTKHYGQRLLDAFETAMPTFSDYGTGNLDENGECYIIIDPEFLETINGYPTVFLTKYGPGDIWFDEQASQDIIHILGTPNLKFSWEVRYQQKNSWNIRMRQYNFEDFIVPERNYAVEGDVYFEQIEVDYERLALEYVNEVDQESQRYGDYGTQYFNAFEATSLDYEDEAIKYLTNFERNLIG